MGTFTLNPPYTWNFPSNNFGQVYGIADSGVETFNGTPIKSLAREICQNSIDANIGNGQPTYIEFKLFEIAPSDIPDVSSLNDAFQRSYDFWAPQKADKAKKFFSNAISTAEKPKIRCLRISDHNTTGLTGSKAEYNSPWCNLTKSTGASDKSGSNGGSFGIGKFAPYACSAFRTVFYSTVDNEGISAYQGVSRLTSFKKDSGEITQGTGFYGEDKNAPVFSQYSLDPAYKRSETDYGTDIFILGFTGDDDWQKQMVASILDGFLFAVYSGNLVVDVDCTIINKDALPDLMESHKGFFREHADEYYRVLTDDKSVLIKTLDITEDIYAGKITLYLMIMPEFHRRVAMVRQTGMKIKDKGNINGIIPFAGILYIEGDALNTYLRGLENPQHLEWEIGRADNKSQAKKLINCFTKFIKECLDELRDDDGKETLDPSVGEYLSAEQEESPRPEDLVENLNDNIKSINIKVNPIIPKATGEQSSGSEKTEVDDPNGDIIVTDVPGEGGRNGDQPGGRGIGGGGHSEGTSGGGTPVEHRKSLGTIAPAKVRVFCKNKDAGEYTIVFTPSVDAETGVIDLFMSAESQNYDATIIAAICATCPSIKFSKNRIMGLTFKEKQPLSITVTLDYHDYCSMEIKAYGNKV